MFASKSLAIFVGILLALGGCSPLLKKGVISARTQSQFSRVGSPSVFENLALSFQLTPLNANIRVGQRVSFRLTFWREGEGTSVGPFVDPGLSPHVWLWMRMPGGDDHGSSQVVVVPTLNTEGESSIGSYDVTRVVFNMAREWEIHIELRRADGTVVDAVIQTIWI